MPHAGLKATNRGRLVRSARRGRYEIGIMGEMNRNSATDSEREAGELPDPALEIEASGDANQAMYLPFTSGTTGEPEGGYAQRQHAARHGTDDGARLPVGARGALNAEPVQPQSGSRCADHRARRRRRTGRPRSARGASLLDRLEETRTEFLFGVPREQLEALANEVREFFRPLRRR